MIRLKIISDGTPTGTKVIDSETGEEIEGIRRVEWSISFDEISIVKIEIGMSLIEAIGSKIKIVKPKKKGSGSMEVKEELMDISDDVPF